MAPTRSSRLPRAGEALQKFPSTAREPLLPSPGAATLSERGGTERERKRERDKLFSVGPRARLRPLSGAFIVGLAFNEQVERQIKAAVIRRNPRLAGYPGAGVI